MKLKISDMEKKDCVKKISYSWYAKNSGNAQTMKMSSTEKR